MDWFVVSPWLLAGLFLVAVLAGFIDTLAGGGGLITIPALLAAGLPPTQALATNKLQSVGGSFSASLYFVRRGTVKLADQKRNIAMTLLGAAAGAVLIQHVRADLLRQLLPLLVIAMGLYFLLMPRIGAEDRQRRLSGWPFALVAGGCVGFYDGFFGPGAGSFYALAFVMLSGYNLATVTAHAKVLNFTSNFGGLMLFVLSGKVIWAVGLVMLAGQILGARLGARMVLARGQQLIRPMIVAVSLLMSIKLIYDNHGAAIAHWLAVWL
ncbi:sulfite exporter TauE/SafE family protein [Sodalis praecaptivus]|uniref:sulfite exporter TauE/SafE family protein n=1 Tax=Sodalis praecaptivus TaxID=1239307 RepID=UPI0027F11ACE|nr:sulfite exporter TauE/SafE family protein [Sodalis praecaptivus]CAJ0995107.1 putative membrane transporter protein YfcA [Sodalis praecaptivus]